MTIPEVAQDKTKSWVQYPKPGEIYIHYKGGEYEVMTLAEDDKDETVVVYRSILFGSHHTRPLKEWFDIVNVKSSPRGDDVKTARFAIKRRG